MLESIVDPSAAVTPEYRRSTVVLTDGRVLNAIVNDRGGPTVVIQTQTERLIVRRDAIEEIRKTSASLMPEGLLDVLPANEVRDLIAYVMSPVQVPLSDHKTNAQTAVP